MGAGLPAKNLTQCMAPAWPVFAGKPAPTGIAQTFTHFCLTNRYRFTTLNAQQPSASLTGSNNTRSPFDNTTFTAAQRKIR